LIEGTNSKQDDVILEHQEKLRESEEAAILKLLFPLINHVKQRFSEKVKQEISAAILDQEQLVAVAKKEAISLGHKLRANREEIKSKLLSFVEQHASDVASVAERKLILCTATKCFNLFYPDLVRTENRCYIPDCMSNNPNCGCGMHPYPCGQQRCGRFYCKDHYTGHDCPSRQHRGQTNQKRRRFFGVGCA
jgi:hypothetical protein